MTIKEDTKLCMALNKMVKDENKSQKDYIYLMDEFGYVDQLNTKREETIIEIIHQEQSHEKIVKKMAAEVNCEIKYNK